MQITSTNNGLTITDGATLAVIDQSGNVIQQGDEVSQAVFDAMTNEVIQQFCRRFTAFTAEDFKKWDDLK